MYEFHFTENGANICGCSIGASVRNCDKCFTTDTVPFDELCICTGAKPKLIAQHANVIGLRDLQSVEELVQRLRGATARTVVVVGNGGIALELIHEVRLSSIPSLLISFMR